VEYKGYTAKIEFDDEAGLFHGRVLNLRDVITFQGTTVDELRHEFAESVEDYLEWCAERGEGPEKPCSGKFVVRIEPELHRDIIVSAELSNQSLNSWVANILQEAVTTSKEKKAKKPEIVESPVTSKPTVVAGDFLQISMTRQVARAELISTPTSKTEPHEAPHKCINKLNTILKLSHVANPSHETALKNVEEYHVFN
jgi:predicted HicB family RNase H-like nuclease